MNEETIDLQQLAGLARKYGFLLVGAAVVGLFAGYGGSYLVKPKYKAISVLNIQNSYFHIPLVNDLISGTSESEVQAQKDALLRTAINDDFVENIGKKYKVFQHPDGTAEHIVERDFFKKSIEQFPLTSTSIQIGASASDSKVSFDITTDVLERIVDVFVTERGKMILKYRETVQNQLDSAKGTRRNFTPSELETLEAEIAALERQYAPEHPTIVAMKQKAAAMKHSRSPAPHREDSETGGRKESQGESMLRDDLARKLKYLDIALEIEKDREKLPYLSVVQKPVIPTKPISPKRRNFAAGGAVGFIMIALIWIVFQELKRMSIFTPELAAKSLGYPLIGVLPRCISLDSSIETQKGTIDRSNG